jgi:4-amino-4-deoxy-L-arabinose transferase-like glycosyltransferase
MKSPILKIILAFTLIHLFVALGIGLGVDEAHYVLYGIWPDLSYFDHPPLVGWIQFLFVKWPLPWELKARIPAILCSALSSYFVYQWLRSKDLDESSALWGVSALNLCLLFEGLSLFFLPDSLLLVLVPLFVLAVTKLRHHKNIKNWILLGLVLGLSGLSKYTAVLFLFPLIILWIQDRAWRDIFTFGFWCGVLIAGICVAPILLWNQQHDWMSFKYQSGHVLSWNTFELKGLVTSQLSQWIGLGFFYTWFLRVLTKRAVNFQFERNLVGLCLVFFSFFALFGNFLPHWTAPAFVLGIPWGVAQALSRGKPFPVWLRNSFIAATILFTLINLELGTHLLPAPWTKAAYRDIQGWPEYVKNLSERAHANNENLGVTNWTFGSRFTLFSSYRNEVFVLDDRKDQFDLWNPQSPEGRDFLIAVEPEKSAEFFAHAQCDSLTSEGAHPLLWREQELIYFDWVNCRGFHWR